MAWLHADDLNVVRHCIGKRQNGADGEGVGAIEAWHEILNEIAIKRPISHLLGALYRNISNNLQKYI